MCNLAPSPLQIFSEPTLMQIHLQSHEHCFPLRHRSMEQSLSQFSVFGFRSRVPGDRHEASNDSNHEPASNPASLSTTLVIFNELQNFRQIDPCNPCFSISYTIRQKKLVPEPCHPGSEFDLLVLKHKGARQIDHPTVRGHSNEAVLIKPPASPWDLSRFMHDSQIHIFRNWNHLRAPRNVPTIHRRFMLSNDLTRGVHQCPKPINEKKLAVAHERHPIFFVLSVFG